MWEHHIVQVHYIFQQEHKLEGHGHRPYCTYLVWQMFQIQLQFDQFHVSTLSVYLYHLTYYKALILYTK